MVYFLLYPLARLFVIFRPQDELGLRQRLGWHTPSCRIREKNAAPRIWIHAASVGEVAAAGVLIRELQAKGGQLDIVLTTMTVQGLAVARQKLPEDVCCFLAPLDLPQTVRHAVSQIRPDLYTCMETELWPAILGELRRAGTAMVLVNGRMTAKSFRRYRLVRRPVAGLLQGFAGVAVIGDDDRKRFAGLGVFPSRIRVTGNIKFDFPPEDMPALRSRYRQRLGVGKEAVFLCGSTRRGEERQLAGVYQALAELAAGSLLWVIAPRHLRRLPEVRGVLAELGLEYDLYSELANRPRRQNVILVDCLGELANMYSGGDYNFVGGSLVARGGHNIMEAARWGLPVYYGPHVDDFSDAAHILEDAGAGFRVADAGQLIDTISMHMRDAESYRLACAGAVKATASQQGAAARQASMITQLLVDSGIQRQDT